MKFKYKSYGYGVLRPVIPVEVIYQDRVISYEVLVDSGADSCIFDAQIGGLLGIDVKAGARALVSGITGVEASYYAHPMTLKIGGWPYAINVGFLPNIARLGYGIVGQRGFFDIFVVKFDLIKKEIELKPRP